MGWFKNFSIFPTIEPRYIKYKHLCSLNLGKFIERIFNVLGYQTALSLIVFKFLAAGSESMLVKKSKKHKFFHWMKKQILISGDHPETWQHFDSYPSMLAERQRQAYEGGKYIIHPLSIF